jgi:dTMP kinase
MARGLFITFEGGEGTGKSTQAALLAERLTGSGRRVVQTREPGGSPGAEAIRALLVEGAADRWSARSEALLMYAARSDHLERVIEPALAAGAIVICDRFADSTAAYQGAGGGVDAAFVAALEREVVGAAKPDLTLILDLGVAEGLARAAARRNGGARFEAKGADFHGRLRQAFRDLARRQPDRCRLIDAAPAPERVADQVWAAVSARLARP